MKKQLDKSKPQQNDWLVGGGKVGKLIRSMDWSNNPLGPRHLWPESLRTSVNLCLASNFPIALAWGPKRIQIYNDGYKPICAKKHPESMGQDFRECWASAWPAVGEAFEKASHGEAAFLTNQRMFLDRNNFLEETFFTFSFSPIIDESGKVAGLFHPVTELTQQSLAERRLMALTSIGEISSTSKNVEEALSSTLKRMAKHTYDIPFVLYYSVDSIKPEARLTHALGIPKNHPCAPLFIQLKSDHAATWPINRALQTLASITVNDLPSKFGQIVGKAYPDEITSARLMPVSLAGTKEAIGVLIAGVSPRRPLDKPYLTFYAMLKDALEKAISNARGYELEAEKSAVLTELSKSKSAFFANVSTSFAPP